MGLEYKKTFSLTTIKSEVKSAVFWRDVIVESLSCLILMIFVILILVTSNSAAYTPNTTHFGLFAGFFVYLLIEGYGPISGAHMNPAASFALCVAGHITPLRAGTYIVAQIVGTAAGAGIGFGLLPESLRTPFPSLHPTPLLTDVQCVMLEACLTFNLLFVALSMADTKNRPTVTLPSLPVAMCIGMGIMAAGTHTGGLQNALVPLGPCFINGVWTQHWIYWAGTFLGGTAGAMTYEFTQWTKRRFGSPQPGTSEHRLSIIAAAHYNDEHSGYIAPEVTLDGGEHHYKDHAEHETNNDTRDHELHHEVDGQQKHALGTGLLLHHHHTHHSNKQQGLPEDKSLIFSWKPRVTSVAENQRARKHDEQY